MPESPVVVLAQAVAAQHPASLYPAPFASRVAGREKRKLGNVFGLNNFGVNLTRLKPGAQSALLHRHTTQDEFIYILEGTPTLITSQGEALMAPGFCAGFPAQGAAHQLVNRSNSDVVYLEVGDRSPNDVAEYPNDDLKAVLSPAGTWIFTTKDGRAFQD